MTVIAWDGKTLAADKRMTYGGHFNTVTKLARAGRYICGFSGPQQAIGGFVAWLNDGENPATFPFGKEEEQKVYALCIRDDGTVWKFENSPYPMRLEDTHAASGSGRDYARAAMHLGKSAREAVEIACLFDESCGNGVDTLSFDEDFSIDREPFRPEMSIDVSGFPSCR